MLFARFLSPYGDEGLASVGLGWSGKISAMDGLGGRTEKKTWIFFFDTIT